MTDKTIIFPFGHIGKFTIGKAMPGAPMLYAILAVPASGSTVSGHGELTQATNPILYANTTFQGVVHVLVFGAEVSQVYALHGTANPPYLGATYVAQLNVTLDGIWGTKGTASYTIMSGETVREVTDQPVTVEWLLQETGDEED